MPAHRLAQPGRYHLDTLWSDDATTEILPVAALVAGPGRVIRSHRAPSRLSQIGNKRVLGRALACVVAAGLGVGALLGGVSRIGPDQIVREGINTPAMEQPGADDGFDQLPDPLPDLAPTESAVGPTGPSSSPPTAPAVNPPGDSTSLSLLSGRTSRPTTRTPSTSPPSPTTAPSASASGASPSSAPSPSPTTASPSPSPTSPATSPTSPATSPTSPAPTSPSASPTVEPSPEPSPSPTPTVGVALIGWLVVRLLRRKRGDVPAGY